MREILAARKLRLFMNRPWQTAILRKLLHGPVTPAVPASYAQRHPDCTITVTEEVTRLPGATLA
jgi:glucosamine-6-phosphate deaminase